MVLVTNINLGLRGGLELKKNLNWKKEVALKIVNLYMSLEERDSMVSV